MLAERPATAPGSGAAHPGPRSTGSPTARDATEVRVHALNNLGTIEIAAGDLAPAPRCSSRASHARPARPTCTSTRLAPTATSASTAVLQRRHDDAERYFVEGIEYCTERDLDSWTLYLEGWRGDSCTSTGATTTGARADGRDRAAQRRARLVGEIEPLRDPRPAARPRGRARRRRSWWTARPAGRRHAGAPAGGPGRSPRAARSPGSSGDPDVRRRRGRGGLAARGWRRLPLEPRRGRHAGCRRRASPSPAATSRWPPPFAAEARRAVARGGRPLGRRSGARSTRGWRWPAAASARPAHRGRRRSSTGSGPRGGRPRPGRAARARLGRAARPAGHDAGTPPG